MQTIEITLSNSHVEEAVLRLAKEQQQNLQEFVVAALKAYVQFLEKREDKSLVKNNRC